MDLNAPLGKKPQPHRRRVGSVVGVTLLALCLGGVGIYLLQADPHGGEPYAVAVIPPPRPVTPVPAPSAADPMPTGSIGIDRPAPDSMRIENGVKVFSPRAPDRVPPRDPGPLVIDVTKALDGNARRGVAPDGKTASAEDLPRINTVPQSAPSRPRVAIFVSGMGLNPLATQTAIETMPGAVSLAFVPSGDNASVETARAKGHEILLQLPMQSTDGAVSSPHMLRADESSADMNRDVAWLMGCFAGYVGVTNLLGAPITSNPTAMTTVLKSVGQHGMFYLDDGTSRRSLAPSVAASLGVPAVQADVVLDATSDPDMVRANLNRLAVIARTRGSAIGMASGFPDHLPAIARFAADLDAQGLILVPVSAIAAGGARLATTR